MSVSTQWLEGKCLIAWLEETIKSWCFKSLYTPSESNSPKKQQGSCTGQLPLPPKIHLSSFFTLPTPEPWPGRTLSAGSPAFWILVGVHQWGVQARKWRNGGEMWISISLASYFQLCHIQVLPSPKIRRPSNRFFFFFNLYLFYYEWVWASFHMFRSHLNSISLKFLMNASGFSLLQT